MKEVDLIQSDPTGDLPDKCSVPPSMAPISGIYDYKYRYSVAESNPGMIHNNPVIMHNTPSLRRRPPSPPKRQSSHPNDLQTTIGEKCSNKKSSALCSGFLKLYHLASGPVVYYRYYYRC